MAAYVQSKGQRFLSKSQISKSLQRINPTDHERQRADTVCAKNPVPYNAAYYGHKLHRDQNDNIKELLKGQLRYEVQPLVASKYYFVQYVWKE